MPVTKDSIVIDRPCEEVFDYVTTTENAPLYNSSLIEVEQLSETVEKGAKARGVVRVAGRKMEWTSEITEFHRPDRYAIRSLEAPIDFEIHWELTDLGDGTTRVDFRNDAPDLKGWWGKLGDGVVQRMYARDVRSQLENLKELLEQS